MSTTCTQSSFGVTLVECLLREEGVDPSTLNLISETCKGVSDRDTGMITFSTNVDSCGTEVTVGAFLQFTGDKHKHAVCVCQA